MKTTNRPAHVAAVVAAALLTCSFAIPALAQDCPELVGRWPYGPVHAVAVSGDYAYFGSGTGLIVAESRTRRRRRWSVRSRSGLGSGVAVTGGYAYVAYSSYAGLSVIDVSTPRRRSRSASSTPWATPWGCRGLGRVRLRRGRLRGSPGDRREHAVGAGGGGVLLHAGLSHGRGIGRLRVRRGRLHSGGSLRVIDVSTPSAPLEVGSVRPVRMKPGCRGLGRLRLHRGRLSGLRVIDVSTRRRRARWAPSTRRPAYGVAVSGGHAYVVGGSRP